MLAAAARQLAEYFAGGRQDFELPLHPGGTPFQQAAWAALRTIPYGATVSYGEQARRLGDANKARAVGAANGRNRSRSSCQPSCRRLNYHPTGFGGGSTPRSGCSTTSALCRRQEPDRTTGELSPMALTALVDSDTSTMRRFLDAVIAGAVVGHQLRDGSRSGNTRPARNASRMHIAPYIWSAG